MSGDVSILILYELSVRFSAVKLHVSLHSFLNWIVMGCGMIVVKLVVVRFMVDVVVLKVWFSGIVVMNEVVVFTVVV